MAPLLDAFAAASDGGRRDVITVQIAEKYGFAALPAARARLEGLKNEAFRPLVINLASRVREVRIEADAGGSAGKSGIASLKGQLLDGARLDKLAHELESAMPPDVRAVTFHAERAGDGTGFKVTIGWLEGGLDRQTGWDREIAVRAGSENLYGQTGYTANGQPVRETMYREMAAAFQTAIESEIDAPVIDAFSPPAQPRTLERMKE